MALFLLLSCAIGGGGDSSADDDTGDDATDDDVSDDDTGDDDTGESWRIETVNCGTRTEFQSSFTTSRREQFNQSFEPSKRSVC